jgi:hypothetical protein
VNFFENIKNKNFKYLKIMGLPKGRTNNISGKPVGTINKTPKAIRDELTEIFFDSLPQLAKDIKTMRPAARKDAIAMILPYITPKLQAATLDATIDSKSRIDGLNDQELNLLIEEILERNEQ